MLPGSPRAPPGKRLREVLRDSAPAGQLIPCVERGHGGGLPSPGDLEFGEAGSSSCQVLRAAYAPGVAGEPAFDAAGLSGRLDTVGDGARGHGKDPFLGPRACGPDALQAGGGVGREVGYVAARFLVSFGARDVKPAGAVGCFHGQVLPLKGCGFAAAQEAIAHCAHERDIHVPAPGGGPGRLHAASPAAPFARSTGGGFYLGDHLTGEPGDLRGLLGTLPPQAPHGLGYGGITRKIGRVGFAAGVAQGSDQLLSPNVRVQAGRSREEGQKREGVIPGAARGGGPRCVGVKAQRIGYDRGAAQSGLQHGRDACGFRGGHLAGCARDSGREHGTGPWGCAGDCFLLAPGR